MTNATDKPWEHEPDHVMFMSEAGYICEIKRHPTLKHLNGYIYIPAGHPDYGKGYNALEDTLAVHGGWTYSHDGGDDDGGKFTIFGFDCGHAGDISPGIVDITNKWLGQITEGTAVTETYRDIAYVTEQLEAAARQFKERKKK